MPRYDYECYTCHHRFEVRQGFDSEPVANCPECENKASRKFSPVPIMFKGSGWYVNDYGKRGGSKNSTETKDSSSSESKSEAKTKSTDKKESSAKSDSSSGKTETSTKAK